MLKLHILVLAIAWSLTLLTLIGSAIVYQSLEPFRFMGPILFSGHLVGMFAFEIYCRFCQRQHTIYRLYGQLASYREFKEWAKPKELDYNTEPDKRIGTSRRAQESVQASAHGDSGLESHRSGLDPDRVGALMRRTQTLRRVDNRIPLHASILRGVRLGVYGVVHDRPLVGVSGMALGTLTRQAVSALSIGGAEAGVIVNTGEGGVATYHVEGGDACQVELQFGTGYFGCRTLVGGFDLEKLVALVARFPQIVSIQIKGSQGAKAGHGGFLPREKIEPEYAQIRGIPMDRDCESPPVHSAFVGPEGLVRFIACIRKATGKPITFKMAIGSVTEFDELCQAIVAFPEGAPDAIQIDGGEGGTGAAYMEVFGQAALPLNDAIQVADLLLRRYNLRDRVKLIGSGQVFQADHIARVMALGADAVMTARGAKYALGCVAAGACHKPGECPSGVANHGEALDVSVRSKYIANYYRRLIDRLVIFVEPMGLNDIAHLVGTRTQFMEMRQVKIWRMSDVHMRMALEGANPVDSLLAT